VISAFEPSVYVPCAVKFVLKPFDTVAAVGLIAMLATAAAVTVKVTLAVTVFAPTSFVALMVVVPTARVEAIPLLLPIVATARLLDDHVTVPETLPALLSEKVPVAVKVTGTPLAVVKAGALRVMTVSTAEVTCTSTLGDDLPKAAADIEALPKAMPLAKPFLSIVAMLLLLEDQVTWLVISAVDWSA